MSRAFEILHLITEQHSYAVVSVMLPDYVADKIQQVKSRIPSNLIDTDEDKDLDPHVTLFYGLSDDDFSDVAFALSELRRPLQYKIDGKLDVFPGKDNKYKVLILPIISDDFVKVHEYIKLVTGKEPPTFREYKPHVTVAYVKPNSPENYVIPFHEISDYADSVDFSTTDDEYYPISLMGNRDK